MKIFNRNQLYNLFKIEFAELSTGLQETIFKSMTDEELAEGYGMKVLRKGYFYR
jgi:hypothetical protein